MTETFIYYELHILGVRGPPWGTLPHNFAFSFFRFFFFFVKCSHARATLATAFALRAQKCFADIHTPPYICT